MISQDLPLHPAGRFLLDFVSQPVQKLRDMESAADVVQRRLPFLPESDPGIVYEAEKRKQKQYGQKKPKNMPHKNLP